MRPNSVALTLSGVAVSVAQYQAASVHRQRVAGDMRTSFGQNPSRTICSSDEAAMAVLPVSKETARDGKSCGRFQAPRWAIHRPSIRMMIAANCRMTRQRMKVCERLGRAAAHHVDQAEDKHHRHGGDGDIAENIGKGHGAFLAERAIKSNRKFMALMLTPLGTVPVCKDVQQARRQDAPHEGRHMGGRCHIVVRRGIRPFQRQDELFQYRFRRQLEAAVAAPVQPRQLASNSAL
jgi:hypothetical protein